MITKEREEITTRMKDLLRNTEKCMETRRDVEEKIKSLKELALKQQTAEVQVHGRDCDCHECTFERKLNEAAISQQTPEFFQSLITNNNIADVELAMKLQRGILELTDDDEYDLLCNSKIWDTRDAEDVEGEWSFQS